MEIKIKKFLWQTSVWVGGFQQSGLLVEKLWQKALKGLTPPRRGETLINALILGLGCGSAIKSLRQKFPDCQITGVEINPEMIAIGKKYFNLDKISNLKIIRADAKKFVSKTKQKFDLILVDLYKGNVPEKQKINYSKILTKNGVVLINHLEGLKNRIEYLKVI
ncbi:methyltransferase domain-containing protein [Candidatus Gottesmanbacteria bacterium]|nr:methyltransferase domain-containing protein [Candidatus Gottesmanbacteria bacterium]